MSSMSFEKSVKGGTKIKLAPPKSKYVENILHATHAGDAGVAEVFRTMQTRLRDSTWTIVFKGLIIIHLMIREGNPDVTLRYIAEHPSKLAISTFSDAQEQGRNIRHYYGYLDRRARAFRDTKIDWVRDGEGRLKRLSVDKGLLRETEVVQRQVGELLRCDVLSDTENEISLTAFRLLVMDLLKLYSVMNEGTIGILEHYFEMSKTDAERALQIYKTFTKQTDEVVHYLGVARTYEAQTRLEIPKLKHAPVGLTQSLTEYLNDPDFDINRRQYLAQQEAKRTGKPVKPVEKSTNGSASKPQSPTSAAPTKGPAPDLIDLFGSIENNQQTMATTNQGFMGAPQQQVYGGAFSPQGAESNPFAAMAMQQQQTAQANTGAGYNPFAPQQPQQQQQQFSPQGDFGPGFQQQMGQQAFMPQQQQQQQQPFQTGQDFFGQPQQQQTFQTGMSQPGFAQPQQPQQQFGQQQNFFSSPQQTGMNGGMGMNNMPPAAPLQPQQTSTNPFRQSMMPQNSGASPASPQSTNPFAPASTGLGSISEDSAFGGQGGGQAFGGQQQFSPKPLQRQSTNPFARTASPAATNNSLSPPAPLVASPTGSTNPFRQSQFVNQQTGQAWQQQSQGTMGGLDVGGFQSIPVFPRPPGQQQQNAQWQ